MKVFWKDLALALKKSEAEVAGLKGALKENDLWLQNTFKYIVWVRKNYQVCTFRRASTAICHYLCLGNAEISDKNA